MVSSPYSDPQKSVLVTGGTHGMKNERRQDSGMHFDFKVLHSIADRAYRLRHGKLHNFAQNLEQNGLWRKKLERFEIRRRKF